MNEIRVLLVDDHQIIIDGIRSLIGDESGIRVVGEASNGKEALDLIRLIAVDVVLMDIDMPLLNGMEATKKIKSDHSSTKVIILTMHNERGLIKTLLEIGADGYLLKNSDKQELLSAIRQVADGNQYFSSDVTMALLNEHSATLSSFMKDKSVSDLTTREVEVLKLIAEGNSNKEIGEQLFISHRTVDTHRTNIMKKLEVSNIAGLIRYAIQHGYVS